jgi:hypothetical protein
MHSVPSTDTASTADPLDSALADPAQGADARTYVKRMRVFCQLLAAAAIVISMIVNYAAGGRLWFQWVNLGYAIAIAFAAFDTFGRNLWLGRSWQERKLREFLARGAR